MFNKNSGFKPLKNKDFKEPGLPRRFGPRKDKSRLIEKIQCLFSQMDNQIPKEKKLKDEELILEEINQEIEQSRKL